MFAECSALYVSCTFAGPKPAEWSRMVPTGSEWFAEGTQIPISLVPGIIITETREANFKYK